ncbi:YopJ family acetyltransferase [Pseudomonas sp. KB_15]|uniref:YopJ family acetyltransferase n=1 Tax=Pseudomonas sp. KB_15 TaxID=3233035 RepID=UPI003F97A966
MGRINSGHTLVEAVSLKLNQADISSKTVRKLAEKIVVVRNCGSAKLAVRTLGEALRRVDSIKNTPAQEKMKKMLLYNYAGAASTFAVKLLESNKQPGALLSLSDDRLMSSMVSAEKDLHPGIELNMFRSVDHLAQFILKKTGPYLGQAVVKMARHDEPNESHFAAVDIRITSSGSRYMVVYESGFIQGNKEAGVDHGFTSLVDGVLFQSSRLNLMVPKVGFVEVGSQKSPSDCGIFALNTAIQNFKSPEVTEWLLNKMDVCGQVVTRFYDESASGYIISKGRKFGVTLPPRFHKHDHSISTLKKMGGGSVNKRNESVGQRASHFKVERDELVYSNSIEHKRHDYYQHVVERLKNNT